MITDVVETPVGYKQADHLFSDFQEPRWQLFLWANLLALLPLSVGVVILWFPYQWYVFIGLPLAVGAVVWGTAVTILIALIIIVASILIHELLHALALKLLGYQPIIGMDRGFPVAGIVRGEFLSRNHYLIVTVTPLLSMTLIGGTLLLFLPHAIGKLLLIALLLNFPASFGDLIVAQRVRRYPSQALFANDDNHIYAYLPICDTHSSHTA